MQEAERIEEFFDTARARVEWLGSRQEVTERRFATHQVPWDKSVFKATRHAGLHLGVIYMSRSALLASSNKWLKSVTCQHCTLTANITKGSTNSRFACVQQHPVRVDIQECIRHGLSQTVSSLRGDCDGDALQLQVLLLLLHVPCCLCVSAVAAHAMLFVCK